MKKKIENPLKIRKETLRYLLNKTQGGNSRFCCEEWPCTLNC